MHTRTICARLAFILGVLAIGSPAFARADVPGVDPVASRWSFQTRAIMTGSSEGSEPEGFGLYSAIAFEIGMRRSLTPRLALELTTSLQSREMELKVGSGKGTNLGSVEVLPLNLFLQWHPRSRGKVRPYLGVGPNFMVFWEKSGSLDSTDLTPSFGMAAQVGLDVEISPAMFFNAAFTANSSTSDLKSGDTKIATLRIHPATLGVGLGFRF